MWKYSSHRKALAKSASWIFNTSLRCLYAHERYLMFYVNVLKVNYPILSSFACIIFWYLIFRMEIFDQSSFLPASPTYAVRSRLFAFYWFGNIELLINGYRCCLLLCWSALLYGILKSEDYVWTWTMPASKHWLLDIENEGERYILSIKHTVGTVETSSVLCAKISLPMLFSISFARKRWWKIATSRWNEKDIFVWLFDRWGWISIKRIERDIYRSEQWTRTGAQWDFRNWKFVPLEIVVVIFFFHSFKIH